MYYAFTTKFGHMVICPCEQTSISLQSNGNYDVGPVHSDGSGLWENVKNLQVISHPQDCLAWMGIGVDTEGRAAEPPATKVYVDPGARADEAAARAEKAEARADRSDGWCGDVMRRLITAAGLDWDEYDGSSIEDMEAGIAEKADYFEAYKDKAVKDLTERLTESQKEREDAVARAEKAEQHRAEVLKTLIQKDNEIFDLTSRAENAESERSDAHIRAQRSAISERLARDEKALVESRNREMVDQLAGSRKRAEDAEAEIERMKAENGDLFDALAERNQAIARAENAEAEVERLKNREEALRSRLAGHFGL